MLVVVSQISRVRVVDDIFGGRSNFKVVIRTGSTQRVVDGVKMKSLCCGLTGVAEGGSNGYLS
jgi:hypothetical protein